MSEEITINDVGFIVMHTVRANGVTYFRWDNGAWFEGAKGVSGTVASDPIGLEEAFQAYRARGYK